MKILLLTGNDSAMDLVGNLTAPQLAWYARRMGYDFERVREYEPDSHPSWQKMRLIQERLPHYDAILWVDADAIVTHPDSHADLLLVVGYPRDMESDDPVPTSPGIPIPSHRGLTVSADWTRPAGEDAIKHFSLGNFLFTNCEESFRLLELAMKRTEWMNTPLWEQQAIQEEYRANEEVRRWVNILPRRMLNAVPATPNTTGPEPWEPGDFICHFTYLPHQERARLIPEAIVSGFRACLPHLPDDHETGMSMDVRHILMIREIAKLGWTSALEIGVWKGGSSAAFVDAIHGGEVKRYTACDVNLLPEFMAVMRPVIDRDLNLLVSTGAEALEQDVAYDLILVDGDHSLDTGQREAALLIERQPRCILAHDVRSASVGYGNCEGPAHLETRLREDGWTIFVDAKDRPGEATKRGFMAATKDAALAATLAVIFEEFAW